MDTTGSTLPIDATKPAPHFTENESVKQRRMMLKDVKLDFDPYELLEITHEAEERDVLRAYRKKALRWHPDKNSDKKEFGAFLFSLYLPN